MLGVGVCELDDVLVMLAVLEGVLVPVVLLDGV